MTSLPWRRVVDSHLHVWPDALVGLSEHWPTELNPNPIEAMVPVLDAAGVTAAVQVTPSILGFDNSYGLEAAERIPGRFSVYGRLDPDAPDPYERLREWMANPSALGVRLMLSGADIRADHPFLSAAEDLGVPVAAFTPASLRRLVEVAELHPDLYLVVDHLGLDVYGPDPFVDQPLLAELAPFERVRVKISGLVEASREPFPFRDVHDHLARAVEIFGAGRLMWGSNYPVSFRSCSYDEGLRFLAACDSFLAGGDLEQVLAGTFDAFVRGPRS